MKLQPLALGAGCAVTLGLASLLATLFSLWFGEGGTIETLGAAYFGFTRTYVGAALALLWGAVYGFVGGAVLASVYNRFAGAGA